MTFASDLVTGPRPNIGLPPPLRIAGFFACQHLTEGKSKLIIKKFPYEGDVMTPEGIVWEVI